MNKVFVNGCFDVITSAHIELFKYARSLGYLLLVAIDSDERITQLKGDTRPINNVQRRASVLEAIKYIDYVTVFDTPEDLENIIKKHKPDIMVVGSDYRDKPIIGSKYVGKVIFFERIEGISSTNAINKNQ